jgi:hypothetical protein
MGTGTSERAVYRDRKLTQIQTRFLIDAVTGKVECCRKAHVR